MSISDLSDIVVIIADIIAMAMLGLCGGIMIMLYIQNAAQQSVQLTALRRWLFILIALNVLSWSIVVAMFVGGN